jgi:chromosome segregation ATPase
MGAIAQQAEMDALRAQRNREADAVATLNGLLAEARAEVSRLAAALDDARTEIDTLRAMAPPAEPRSP